MASWLVFFIPIDIAKAITGLSPQLTSLYEYVSFFLIQSERFGAFLTLGLLKSNSTTVLNIIVIGALAKAGRASAAMSRRLWLRCRDVMAIGVALSA